MVMTEPEVTTQSYFSPTPPFPLSNDLFKKSYNVYVKKKSILIILKCCKNTAAEIVK